MATRRTNFDDKAPDAPAQDTTVRRMRYPCAAHQCPMPGALYLGGNSDGLCGWHAREPSGDWAKITQALRDWECVTLTVNAIRRAMTDPATCADPKAQRETMERLWAQMRPAVLGGWTRRTEPQRLEHLGDWGRRLEAFLGARVKERQRGEGVVDETHPTPYVAEVRAGLRDTPLKGNAADNWGTA